MEAGADESFEALLRYMRDSRGSDFTGYKHTSLSLGASAQAQAGPPRAPYPACETHAAQTKNLHSRVLANVDAGIEMHRGEIVAYSNVRELTFEGCCYEGRNCYR